jgi:hypothetical protein
MQSVKDNIGYLTQIKDGFLCNQCYEHAMTCSLCNHKVEDTRMFCLNGGNYCFDCFYKSDHIFQYCSDCGQVFYSGNKFVENQVCLNCNLKLKGE